MRVISTARATSVEQHGWSALELEQLMRLYASQSCRRKVTWGTAVTEINDPQFFLVGPEPDGECLIALSRIDGAYVLEDGEGWPLYESRELEQVVQQAQATLATRRKPSLVLKVMVPFVALKAFFDEKVEPLIPDSIEVMLHLPALV